MPWNGVVTQAMAADLIGVSRMAVNTWVRYRKIRHIKVAAKPSVIPLSEVKRVKKLLTPAGRLPKR